MNKILLLSSSLLALSVLLLLLISSSSSPFAAVHAFLPTEEGETPEDQEHKYRPMIRCLVCENMVKRLIHKMNTSHSNLGSSIKTGRDLRAATDAMGSNTHANTRRKATVSAWAHELVTVENLCRISQRELQKDEFLRLLDEKEAVKGPKGKIYCEQAVEATEDRLIRFARARKMNESVAEIDMNTTAEDVCTKAKYCKVRSEIKNSMEAAQESAKKQFLENNPLWKLVLMELKKNVWWYVGLFFGTITVMTVGLIGVKYYQIRKRIKERRYQEAMAALKKTE